MSWGAFRRASSLQNFDSMICLRGAVWEELWQWQNFKSVVTFAWLASSSSSIDSNSKVAASYLSVNILRALFPSVVFIKSLSFSKHNSFTWNCKQFDVVWDEQTKQSQDWEGRSSVAAIKNHDLTSLYDFPRWYFYCQLFKTTFAREQHNKLPNLHNFP